MRGRLFESMVSVREPRAGGAPHLGLGLYVARLIAEFHGGAIEAADTAARDGVIVRVNLPLAR
jgi:K+-sensing histidine kinase KdpD